ncbi:hypothetical protein TRM7557_00233 [Tritonibacter multivorans]|uniref:Uncharacterized protein n=2 Tax=Tritonibacter multivorans TaxID=928856 RepID=A0A0P1G085_9RHOB|nr:hypothetical protein TRM7557_00233 [Tritonibacter multivorans]SFD79033.1 hypothetical protein SAMN04488049_13112 [Tritonibacter multivorans]
MAGLGAVTGFFSGIVFLVVLLVVQPLDLSLLPRRMWMHQVTIQWVLVAFGASALCVGVIWFQIKAFSKPTPQPVSRRTKASIAPATPTAMPSVPGAVWVFSTVSEYISRRIDPEVEPPDFLELIRRNRKGEDIAADAFPRSFILRGQRVPRDILHGNFLFVSRDIADILADFDLGRSQLIPLDGMYRGRDRTKLDKDYFILTFASSKTVFSPEGSNPAAIRQSVPDIPWWKLFIADFPDGSFAVTEDALEGADFWSDPTTPVGMLYMSEHLKAALDAQGIGKKMGFKRCRVVRSD